MFDVHQTWQYFRKNSKQAKLWQELYIQNIEWQSIFLYEFIGNFEKVKYNKELKIDEDFYNCLNSENIDYKEVNQYLKVWKVLK